MSKTYVITGASSGIGRAITEYLAKDDNVIFASYRSDDTFLKGLKGRIYPFYVDYSKPETIQPAIDFIKTKTDKVNTLINAIGCVVAGPIEKISVEEIRKQFNVNVFGHIELTQGLLDLLNNGKIINVSSMASYGIFPFISPYCASKKCLDMFFNSLLVENHRNIKVVSIKPGVISTPLWGRSIEENTKNLVDCSGYEKEMEYVIKNAQKNETCGLRPEKVVKAVIKADSLKNPKLTYTVGKDAFVARILSKIPQEVINKLVRLGIKIRVNNVSN